MFGQFIKKRVLRTSDWRVSTPSSSHAAVRKNSHRPAVSTPHTPVSPISGANRSQASENEGSENEGSETYRRWKERLGTRMLAVFSQRGNTRVGILQVSDVQESGCEQRATRITVKELQLTEGDLANNCLNWDDSIELEADQVLYFEILKRELDIREFPAYREAIQRLTTVATLLEMEANLTD